jgi:hypothetical protein
MSLGPIVYATALAVMTVMLVGTVLFDGRARFAGDVLNRSRRPLRGGLRRAPFRTSSRFVLQTSLAGLAPFALPPFGEMPLAWETGLAFFIWVAWCYRYGLVARRRFALAAAEAIPALSLSLVWVQLLMAARGGTL